MCDRFLFKILNKKKKTTKNDFGIYKKKPFNFVLYAVFAWIWLYGLEFFAFRDAIISTYYASFESFVSKKNTEE